MDEGIHDEVINVETAPFCATVRCFDNQGVTLDRYTVVVDEPGYHLYTITMSHNAESSQGVCRTAPGGFRPNATDKRIEFSDLPDACQRQVKRIIQGG